MLKIVMFVQSWWEVELLQLLLLGVGQYVSKLTEYCPII